MISNHQYWLIEQHSACTTKNETSKPQKGYAILRIHENEIVATCLPTFELNPKCDMVSSEKPWYIKGMVIHPRKGFLIFLLRVIPNLTNYSVIVSDIPSGSILACIFWPSIWHSFWHSIWHLFWHPLWHGHCRTSTASGRKEGREGKGREGKGREGRRKQLW